MDKEEVKNFIPKFTSDFMLVNHHGIKYRVWMTIIFISSLISSFMYAIFAAYNDKVTKT